MHSEDVGFLSCLFSPFTLDGNANGHFVQETESSLGSEVCVYFANSPAPYMDREKATKQRN